MKVLKFGGGCLKDAKSIKKVPKIISHYDDDIVIVLSAFGKITNMLEDEKHEDVFLFIQSIMIDLGFSSYDIDDILKKQKTYFSFSNRISYPDRVSIGEYLSSEIIHRYLKLENIDNMQLDATKYIFTDSWDPNVNSAKFHSINVPDNFLESIVKQKIITQGFIASDVNSGAKTTLGREGSDYSAAIFGAAFNVDEVILFKDVDGVYSADPKKNSDVELFSHLSYDAAFELCSNGNTVVHPKTINHLKKKRIPLIIKNFDNFRKPGTVIS
ncbi:MAG: 16S rRNA (cytosine(1402)-N(4))-methyltransferase [Flavobacteriales bacterium]|nr:16S rRNA (cytosine(1402)-N(4))-methyltransferase [Flavobacteriales bacterium]